MINKKHIYQYLLLPLLACLMAGTAGCSSDADSTPNGEGSRYVNVTMNIATRATEVPTAGTNKETDIKTIRVYAFSGDEQVGYYYSDVIANPAATHTFSMKIEQIGSSNQQNVDFYLVANEAGAVNADNVVWKMTKAELDELKFTSLNTNEYLPATLKTNAVIYFGTGTADNNSLSCELVHPVGKLGIHFAKSAECADSDELVVDEITMTNVLAYNYWMERDKLDSPVLENQTMNVVSKVTVTSSRTSDEQRDENDFQDLLVNNPYYPFENPNGVDVGDWYNEAGQTAGNILNIRYTLNGREQTKIIYMPKIERNDWHDFFFTVKPNAGIEIEYTVADWDEDPDGEYEIEYNYPQYTNPIQPGNGATLEGNATYEQPTVWCNINEDSDEGSYTFQFKITGPTGQKWTPTLVGALGTSDNFEVKVYQILPDGSKNYIDNSNDYVASKDPYYIMVKAKNANNVDKEVGLGIAYERDWSSDGSALLLINGLTGSTKWEGSTVAEVVMIKQIEVPESTINN